MNLYEKNFMGMEAVKGGVMGVAVAVASGFAVVEKTVFFGLVVTGTALSLPAMATAAGIGAAVGGGVQYASTQYRKRMLRRQLEAMAKPRSARSSGRTRKFPGSDTSLKKKQL